MSALSELTHNQRSAVVLRYFLDLTDGEIAASIGCSPANVRTLLSRAMKRLRRELMKGDMA